MLELGVSSLNVSISLSVLYLCYRTVVGIGLTPESERFAATLKLHGKPHDTLWVGTRIIYL